jgi:hypothetical protein
MHPRKGIERRVLLLYKCVCRLRFVFNSGLCHGMLLVLSAICVWFSTAPHHNELLVLSAICVQSSALPCQTVTFLLLHRMTIVQPFCSLSRPYSSLSEPPSKQGDWHGTPLPPFAPTFRLFILLRGRCLLCSLLPHSHALELEGLSVTFLVAPNKCCTLSAPPCYI